MNWWQRFKRSSAHTQANIVCTVFIMLATIAYTVIAARQLIFINRQIGIMQDTLNEQRRSGEQSTAQMWSAIGNINWMARSADWSQKVTKASAEASDRQSNKALNASIDNFHQDQRAWVGFSGFSPQVLSGPINETLPNFPPAYQTFVADLFNSGRTPAREVEVIASVHFVIEPHILDKRDENQILTVINSIDSGELKPDPTLKHKTGGNVLAGYSSSTTDLGYLIFEKSSLGVIPPNIPIRFQIPTTWARGGSDPLQTLAFGRLKYRDASGKSHFTTFCTYRTSGLDSTLRVCPILNDMQ